MQLFENIFLSSFSIAYIDSISSDFRLAKGLDEIRRKQGVNV